MTFSAMAGRHAVLSNLIRKMFPSGNFLPKSSSGLPNSHSVIRRFSISASLNSIETSKFGPSSAGGSRENLHARCAEFRKVCAAWDGPGSVDLHVSDHVAEIKLHNPTRKNAFSGKMFLDLENIVTELESWEDGKVVILHGDGPSFCSGGDLNFVKEMFTAELGAQMSIFMQSTLHRLENLRPVVVVLIRGVAHGGGAELTTAADFRLLTKTSDIKFVQARLGITTGWGGASRLARLIGVERALPLLCSGAAGITAANGRALGFATATFHDTDGLPLVKEWIEDNFLRCPADVIHNYKRVVKLAGISSATAAYDLETEVFRTTWGSQRHADALQQAAKERETSWKAQKDREERQAGKQAAATAAAT